MSELPRDIDEYIPAASWTGPQVGGFGFAGGSGSPEPEVSAVTTPAEEIIDAPISEVLYPEPPADNVASLSGRRARHYAYAATSERDTAIVGPVLPEIAAAIGQSGFDRSAYVGLRFDTDKVAVFCQQSIAISKDEATSRLSHPLAFEHALTALEEVVAPITTRIIGRYHANSRIDKDDFGQIIREHLLDSIIPQFDPEKANFKTHYKNAAWRRLDMAISKNMAPFTTATHRKHMAQEAIQAAMSTLSTDDKDAMDKRALAGLGAEARVSLPPTPASDIVDTIARRDELSMVADVFRSGLSDFERAVVTELLVNGRSYKPVALQFDTDVKSIDNALQRAQRKLRMARLNHGFVEASSGAA